MGMFDALHTSGSALDVERRRLEVISENIANINSPRSADGFLYQARRVVTTPIQGSFGSYLRGFREFPDRGVAIDGIYEVESQPRRVYDPGHPVADENGFVDYPDINILDEMVASTIASRSYQANLTTFNEAKKMFLRALDIGK